ncbi:hypothetical protein S40293_09769 [Stachybotrys chartarum IBT 40293]|nr:hypothetical protein S40293_09769 [Stachybotrys chartarum IBT 40293]
MCNYIYRELSCQHYYHLVESWCPKYIETERRCPPVVVLKQYWGDDICVYRAAPPSNRDVSSLHIINGSPDLPVLDRYYTNTPPPPPSLSRSLHETGNPLPGPMPSSAYPTPPRYAAPCGAGYSNLRGPLHPIDLNFNDYSHQDLASSIMLTSSAIFNFSQAHSGTLGRPTEEEIAGMRVNAEVLGRSLERFRSSVRTSVQSEQVTGSTEMQEPSEGGQKMRVSAVCTQAQRKQPQRGAPPGRCRNCKATKTPEWRRGPDGARSLCNACGLQYAKLKRERKKQKDDQAM